MKHLIRISLMLMLCLSGCNTVENEEERVIGTPVAEILVSPSRSIAIGKEGGTVVVTAYYSKTLPDGSANLRVLNDELIETQNFDAPYVQFKGRERIDNQTVQYTFIFEENTTGEERGPVAAAITDSINYPSIGFGWFSIKQAGE